MQNLQEHQQGLAYLHGTNIQMITRDLVVNKYFNNEHLLCN